MNANTGVVSSAYPASLSTEEERWRAMNYGHHQVDDANIMNNRGFDPVAMSYFPPETTTTTTPYYNQSNTSMNNINTDGGTANVQNFMSGFVPNKQVNNTGFGNFFFNPLGLFNTNYNTAPTNPPTTVDNTSTESSTNYAAIHPETTTVAPSPDSLPQYSYPTSHSPIPMAFMTPNQGPTPCATPPESPLFLDSHSFQEDIVSVSTNQNAQVSLNRQAYAPSVDNEEHGKSVPSTSTSRFTRGISTMGSALGTVADYVNQSLLLGIPFHIADHAMKESKESYAKWWEGGIGKRNHLEDNTEETKNPVGKKRRLNPNAASTRVGSTLTTSLAKNYIDVLRATCNVGGESTSLIASSQNPPVAVDSSIIKRRRGYNEETQSTSASISDSLRHLNSDSGYNAFNDIGGMYDFGGACDSDNDHKSAGNEVDTEKALPADSNLPYSDPKHHDGPDDRENDQPRGSTTAAAAAAAAAPAATTTITSDNTSTWNNLDGAMQIIGELLQEKNQASEENEIFQMVTSPRDWVKKSIRSELIEALEFGKGDVHDKRFLSVLEILSNFYKTSGRDARVSPWSGRGFDGGDTGGPTASDFFEGHWVNMSRPNYIECLGENGDNDFMYTLGRMSFDMFQPSNLICSVQSTHTTIKIIGEREELPAFVPKSLKDEVASLCDFDDSTTKRPLLRSYE